MNFRFSRLSVLLLLLAPALFAQEPFPIRQIEAALEDGLYPLAEQRLWESLSIASTPDTEATLTILLLRALRGQQKLIDAIILADESTALPQQDAFAYWRARVLFESGNSSATIQALEKVSADSTYRPAATRLKGRAELAANDLQSAQKTFEAFRDQFPTDEDAAQNLLDLAETYLARNKKNDSSKTLRELLERFPTHALADNARLELARRIIMNGGQNDLKEASVLLTILGTCETAPARLRSTAWMELSALEQRAGNAPAAVDALARAEKLTGETALRIRQKASRAGLLMDENKTKEAFPLFDEAIKEAPNTDTAAEILILKAEALLKTQQVAAAEKAFQTALDITMNPEAQTRAQTGKGWSLWEQKRYEEAAIAFENAALKCTQPDRCATALIKAGDARLAASQYEKARDNYSRVNRTYPTHPLAAQAMYQSGIVSLLAAQPGAAHIYFNGTEKDFPQSEFAPQAALQQAELLKREQKWDPALEQYRRIATQYTNVAIQAASLNQQGLILYRLEKWEAALDKFRAVSEKFPEAPEAPQAVYMQGFCRYMQGDINDSVKICKSFIEKYPDSVWTPEVLFWLGEHHYNLGDYTQAKTTFLDIVARFPKHELSDESLFWAGNSLLKQNSFFEAFTLFSRLAKEYPASPLILKTRFAQGETLTELGEFPRAILAYEEVIKKSPDDPLADRARGRLADCLFTLGTSEVVRYQEALDAYQTLYKRPSAPFALRLQALYKTARCETKMGLKEKAFAHYMEVVYSVTTQTNALSPESIPWFTRAAFDAAAYQEQQQQWQEVINIYKRIIQADVPAKNEAQKQIKKIEREHAGAL